MNFGKALSGESKILDYILPPDPGLTVKTLSDGKTDMPLKAYVGCAKWGAKEWVGQIYPPKSKEFLTEYVKHFNAIELNTTFYQMPTPGLVQSWKEKAIENPDFLFCPKIPQNITHTRRLKNAERLTEEFYSAISAFGQNLGPILLQLNERFSYKSYDDLKNYIHYLPKHTPVFVELRHHHWFDRSDVRKRVFELLAEYNIGAAISDTALRRNSVHMTLPTSNAFIRFVGNGDVTDFHRLDDWVLRIKQWRDMGLHSLYFFIHQSEDKKAPVVADYLIKRLNDKLGINIARPKFLPNQNTLL